MDAGNAKGKANKPNQKKRNPLKRIFAFLLIPIIKLVAAIKKQASKQKRGDENPQTIAEMRENEQREANKISKRAMRISFYNLLVTAAILGFSIYSVQTIKSQFELGNQPYLELKIDSVDSIFPNKPIKMAYSLRNYGNYPAKIIDSKAKIAIDTIDPTYEKMANLFREKADGLNEYVGKEYPCQIIMHSDTLSQVLYNSIVDKYSVYFTWYFQYDNLITGKRRAYKVMIKSPGGQVGFQYLVNDNIDIDSTKGG